MILYLGVTALDYRYHKTQSLMCLQKLATNGNLSFEADYEIDS